MVLELVQSMDMKILLLTPEHPSQDALGRGSPVGRDVEGLAKAYMALGHDVRVAVPCYRGDHMSGWLEPGEPIRVSFLNVEGASVQVNPVDWPHVRRIHHPLLVRSDAYLDEHGWDHPDNALRFALYGATALLDCIQEGWLPEIVHGHEWQSGLGILYAANHFREVLGDPRLLFTFQDAAFQGLCDAMWASQIGLGPEWMTTERLEFWGRLNLFKAGLVCAHQSTSPSRHYLDALLADHHGYGLEGLFRSLGRRVTPVHAGIDADFWKIPEAAMETCATLGAWKQANRAAFLPGDEPLVVFASAFRPGRGVDHILTLLPDLLKMNLRIAVVGGQGTDARRHLETVADAHPSRILLYSRGDETLHRVLAAADLLLLPVTHQPGGVLYARSMSMGTPVLAHRMGSVADCVVPHAKAGADGFLFDDLAPDVLLKHLRKAIQLRGNSDEWWSLCHRAASRDFSWARAAESYLALAQGGR
jgi:starch synthase